MRRAAASALATALVLLIASVGAPLAQQRSATTPTSPGPVSMRTRAMQRGTTVIGTAWNADTRPIVGARVRLRNISTGRIEGQTTTNQTGEFRFANLPEGTFVTELLDEAGNVVAVGEGFDLAAGQTVTTFLRAPRPVLFGRLWTNAAVAAVGAAAGLGISALGDCNCAPASAEQPRSPP